MANFLNFLDASEKLKAYMLELQLFAAASLAPQIIARFMSEFTRLSLQLFLIITVSILYHKRVSGVLELPEAGILGLITIVILAASFGIGVVGNLVVALAFKTKSEQAVQAVFPLFFVAVFMSTAYVPKVLLPDWLQFAVDYNPSEYLIRAVRGIFLEGFTDSTMDSVTIAVSCIIVLTTITSTINYRTITRSID